MSSGDNDADVLILGASFAGIEVLMQLVRKGIAQKLKIVVVDRQDRHGYIPLVQERLCGRLPVDDTSLPTAEYVNSLPRVRFVQGDITGFDPEGKLVELASGTTLRARFVVVALGSIVAPPPDLDGAEHMLGHKMGPEFERAHAAVEAAFADDAEEPRVVVVGGGITGVELAAELASPRAGGRKPPHVSLIARSERILPTFSNGIARKAAKVLDELRVDVRTASRLVRVRDGGVVVRDSGGEVEIACVGAFWAGGVQPAPALDQLSLPLTDDGWLAVGPTLQCFATPSPTNPDIFACGDAVRIQGGDGTWPTMRRAIECLWQAKVVAKNIATLAGEKPDYPDGVPPLRPHRLRKTFFYGLSLGPRSLIVYGPVALDLPGVNHWFRRWLMRRYFARYEPQPAPARAANAKSEAR